MHIICPHCTTSYAIDLATLGAAGRTVRCSRCKEVWLARPEDATELVAAAPAMAQAGQGAGDAGPAGWDAPARQDRGQDHGQHQDHDQDHDEDHETPVVDSPSISGDWPASADGEGAPAAD